jgi:hypothetical protein
MINWLLRQLGDKALVNILRGRGYRIMSWQRPDGKIEVVDNWDEGTLVLETRFQNGCIDSLDSRKEFRHNVGQTLDEIEKVLREDKIRCLLIRIFDTRMIPTGEVKGGNVK